VRKVLWVCDELGVDYTREDWGRGFRSTTEAEFLRVNPDRRADKDTDPNRRTRSHGPLRVLPRSEFKVRGQYSNKSLAQSSLSGIWIAVSIFMPMLIASAKGALAREHLNSPRFNMTFPLVWFSLAALGGRGSMPPTPNQL
jgi:hypothetical protein